MKDGPLYKIVRRPNMIIMALYIICWSYILIVSAHTLDITDILTILSNKYDNPFI